jgi:hypothetical protein
MTNLNSCSVLLLLWVITVNANSAQLEQKTWHFNQLAKISGHHIDIEGQPKLINASQLTSTIFDGENDRLQIQGNIVANMRTFTLELVLKPYGPTPKGQEPRIIHIEDPINSQHRITLEMRFTKQNRWYLDAFLMDGDSKYTLIDAKYSHPLNQWANIALSYDNDNSRFTSYVNGHAELSTQLDFSPMTKHANTSAGARMNKVHYFHGELLTLRASNKVLSHAEFLTRPR